MIEKIGIYGFRKYTELHLCNLGQINFVLGDNNVGKTSILESVYTFACGRNVIPLLNIPLARARYSNIQNRYWIMEEILAAVNNRKELPLKMSFEGEVDGKQVRFDHRIYPSDVLTEYDSSYKVLDNGTIQQSNEYIENTLMELRKTAPLSVSSSMFSTVARWVVEGDGGKNETLVTSPLSAISTVQPFLSARFVDLLTHSLINENAQVYALLKREGILEDVVNKMRKVYPEVKGFDMIPYPDGSQAPVSVLKSDGSYVPLYALGDGLQRWFYILGALEMAKKSVVCVDEVDTGIHPDAQFEFCTNLIRHTFENDIQLFVTTHNIEFVDSFLRAASEENQEKRERIRVLSIDKNEDGVRVRTLNSDEAKDARAKYNVELRRI